MTANTGLRAGLLLALLVLAGCAASPTTPTDKQSDNKAEAVRAERAKLDPEDRALVDAQEWCVVEPTERLGSMGPPIKVDIRGQAVFLCCVVRWVGGRSGFPPCPIRLRSSSMSELRAIAVSIEMRRR